MQPLFARNSGDELPVPSALGFASPLFIREAASEILHADPASRILRALDPELPRAFAFTYERPISEIARELSRSATFVHHLQPLDSVVEVTEEEEIVLALRDVRDAESPDRVDLVGLRRAMRRRILRGSAPRATSMVRGTSSSSVLSALFLRGWLYLGRSLKDHAVSPWAMGDPEYPVERVSRAGAKLREALVHAGEPLGPAFSALDLGAAPGGFTSVLLERGGRVVAADPAPLAPHLAGAPGLTSFKVYAQDLPLALVPPLDLITCDIVSAPSEVARHLQRFAPRLAHGGLAIVTLKLRSRPSAREQLRGVASLFAPAFELVRTRHLFANGCEVTAFLRRSGAS